MAHKVYENSGGLEHSTCAVVGTVLPDIHDYIPAALKQQDKVVGAYKCIGAWLESTAEPTAWVLCSVGSQVYAVNIVKNGPFLRIHTQTDPDKLPRPVFSGASAHPVLNKYEMIDFKPVSKFGDYDIPALVRAAAASTGSVMAYADDKEVLAKGYIPETAEELAAMPTLPEATEEELTSLPSSWDVRKLGFDCSAFKRASQGSCGSCWGMPSHTSFF